MMAYDGWILLGGFRLLEGSLRILQGVEMYFRIVDAFEMSLKNGLTLMLVNWNVTGRAGALRELIDSNRSFH